MSEWRKVRIDEIAEKITIGPFGSRMKSDTYTETGVPVIRGTNITGGRSFSGNWVFVSEKDADQLANCNVTEGDLVFPHRGAIGEVGIVPGDRERYLLSTSLMKLRCNSSEADSLFLFYFFKSYEGRHQLLKNASQVGTPGIGQPLSSLKSIELGLPPLDTQRAIAHILGTLDDKIELNRRTNETLEAMARAIFKSWFVNFDPVRGKASGEPPESICRRLALTPELLALFPDGFQVSALGETPEGWQISTMGALCTRISMGPFGSDIKSANFVDEGVPIIRGGNLTNGFVEGKFVFLTERKADELRNANAHAGDIVITHRGTLGQVGLLPRSRYTRYVVSQSQMVLVVNRELTTSRYLYEYLRLPIGQHALLANTSQVGVPAIARPTTSVKAISLVSPPVSLLRAYEDVSQPLFEAILKALEQSCNLTELRSALLPKLLSGELDVRSANSELEELAAC